MSGTLRGEIWGLSFAVAHSDIFIDAKLMGAGDGVAPPVLLV